MRIPQESSSYRTGALVIKRGRLPTSRTPSRFCQDDLLLAQGTVKVAPFGFARPGIGQCQLTVECLPAGFEKILVLLSFSGSTFIFSLISSLTPPISSIKRMKAENRSGRNNPPALREKASTVSVASCGHPPGRLLPSANIYAVLMRP